jgi:acyl-CoA synthetase (NDP forming)
MKKMALEAEGIIEEALSVGHRTLSEYDSKRLVSSFGVPISREDLADDLGSALAKAEEIGYPVVLKACTPQLTHKSEKGLVEVNLRNEQQLSEAFKSIKQNLNGESAKFLVQEMVRGDRELMAGLIKDTQHGPCVMFGLGGIFTEVLADVAFRVAPLSMSDAREMIGETKIACLLGAVRGLQAVDMEKLRSLLVTLGRIGLEIPQVEQVDLNPLIISQGHPVAVDALVVLGDSNKAESIKKESKPYEKGDLAKFFAPRSVAVIGASGVRHKAGNDVIRNIQANEYSGELYLVNHKGGEIEGMPVFKAISELPDDVDLTIIILAAKAVSFMPLPQGNRVAFLAPSGAMLVALTDLCQRRLGLEVPKVTEETRQRLQEISPDFIRMRNPVDIWPSATLKGVAYAYKEGIEAVLKDPNIDAIVTVLMLTEETGVPPLDFIPELAGRHPEKPIYITFSAEQKLMDEAKAYLEHKWIPTYPLIEQPFEVLSILARCRQAMERPGD